MSLRWHRGARRDAEEAATFYENRSGGLGDELLDERDVGLDAIVLAPRRWPLWRGTPNELGIRKYRLKRFPYSIAYVCTTSEILVLAVVHAKRRPGFWRRGK